MRRAILAALILAAPGCYRTHLRTSATPTRAAGEVSGTGWTFLWGLTPSTVDEGRYCRAGVAEAAWSIPWYGILVWACTGGLVAATRVDMICAEERRE